MKNEKTAPVEERLNQLERRVKVYSVILVLCLLGSIIMGYRVLQLTACLDLVAENIDILVENVDGLIDCVKQLGATG